MSIDPQTIWSERFNTIGELIKKHADLLVKRWAVRALKEQPSAERTHHQALQDSLPELVRAIGEGLANSTSGNQPGHRLAALEHGEQRWQVGWRLTEVIQDYQILRLVILDFLDATLTEPLQTRECMAVGLALDEAISASVVAYVHHREHQLKATQDRMTEFLAVLSHELRDPLAPLHAALELLQLQETKPTSQSQQALSTAQRSLQHVTRLVDDLLDVSRVTSGKLMLSKQPLKLSEVVQRALEINLPLIQAREHTLEVQQSPEEIWIDADTVRLTQVLVNLLNNAAKYTPHGGRIQLHVESDSTDAIIRVRDNGTGIKPEMLPHIFDFFVQADTAANRTHGGLGIGLALVSRLVELHGGSIVATSAGLEQGSDFTIRLPRIYAPPKIESPAPAAIASVPATSKKILIIDDNRDGALILALYLESCGHIVEVGHHAQEAMQRFAAQQPDMVILDIGLPQTDGYALARQIRSTPQGLDLPLIAITGYGQEEDRLRALQAGFNHHLVKPVNLPELRRLIEIASPLHRN